MSRNCFVRITKNATTTEYRVRKGLGFQALSLREKTPLEYDCRNADCGICIFRVRNGQENLSSATESETEFLKAMRADPDERLACQCRVMGDVDIEIEF